MLERVNSVSIFERVRDSWIEYSHAAYVTIALGGAFYASAPSKAEWAHKAAFFAIASYFVVLLLFLFYFTHTYSRKARYAEALRLVHSSIHDIRDIAGYLERCVRRSDRFDLTVLKRSLQRCLDGTAMAFTLATGARCRVCIKVVAGGDQASAYVLTACRDKVSEEDSRTRDENEGAKHLVAMNTDFNYLMAGGHSYYFNGDISRSHDYMNSSSMFFNGKKLPYTSTIVLPIRRTYNVSSRAGEVPLPKIVGFLCIDSHARKCFVEKYDVQMGAILADALCPILEWWIRLEKRSKVQANKEVSNV